MDLPQHRARGLQVVGATLTALGLVLCLVLPPAMRVFGGLSGLSAGSPLVSLSLGQTCGVAVAVVGLLILTLGVGLDRGLRDAGRRS